MPLFNKPNPFHKKKQGTGKKKPATGMIVKKKKGKPYKNKKKKAATKSEPVKYSKSWEKETVENFNLPNGVL